MKVRRKGEGEMNRNRFLAGILSLLLIITSVFTGNVVTAGAENNTEINEDTTISSTTSYDQLVVKAGKKLTISGPTEESEPVVVRIEKSLTVEGGGSVVASGDVVLEILSGATASGIELYNEEESLLSSEGTFTNNSGDFMAFDWDGTNSRWVLHVESGNPSGGGNGVKSYGKDGKLAFNIENSDKGDLFFQIGTGTKYRVGGDESNNEDAIISALQNTEFQAGDTIKVWAQEYGGKVVGNFDIRIGGNSVFTTDNERTAARTAAEDESGYTFTVPQNHDSTKPIEFAIEFRDETSGGGNGVKSYGKDDKLAFNIENADKGDVFFQIGSETKYRVGGDESNNEDAIISALQNTEFQAGDTIKVWAEKFGEKIVGNFDIRIEGTSVFASDDARTEARTKAESNEGYTFTVPTGYESTQRIEFQIEFRDETSGGGGSNDVTYTQDATITANTTMNDITVSGGTLTIDNCSVRVDHKLVVQSGASIVGTSENSKLEFAGGAASSGIALYNQENKISNGDKNDYSNNGEGPVEFNWDTTSRKWVTNQQPAEGSGGEEEPNWYTVSYGNSANLTTKNGKVYAERVHIGDITYSSIASEYNESATDKIYSMKDTIFHQKTKEEENDPNYNDPLTTYGIGGSDGDIFIRNDVSGVSIDFKFIPDFGYQLTNIYTNENETDSLLNDFTAAEAVSSFKFNVKSDQNVHFEVKFEKVDNKVTGNANITSAAKIASTNAAASGTLNMKVDNATASSNITIPSGSEALAAYDITLTNEVSKGENRGSWDTKLEDLGTNVATVTLPVDDTTNYTYSVIREHAGETPVTLNATVKNGAISFDTNKFSTYTIVRKPVSSGGGSSNNSGSSGDINDDGKNDVSNVKPSTGNTTSTGVLQGDDGSWYFFKDGVVDENYDDVAHNENGWWVVRDGKVDFSYQGIASNENGDWYCEKGKVNFNANGVLQSTAEESSGWYFVKDGKVQKGKETVEHNANGWWFIDKEGKVDFNKDTVAQNVNGWWVIQKGKVDFNYQGVATNPYGDWFCEKGKVNFAAQGVLQSTAKDSNGWYFVKGGKVQKGKETVEQNRNGWWYVGKDGKVDFNMNTVAQNVNGWWMIQKGKVNFDYKGVASNQYGTWYLEGGKVNFNYNGKYTDANGKQYTIKNGQVIN